MKKLLLVSIVTMLLLPAVALALVHVPAVIQPSGVPVVVPDVAVGNSPRLKGIQPGTLERTIFIHYVDGSSRVVSTAKAPTCYKLLNVKWKSLPINYVVNPSGSGLSDTDIFNAIVASTTEWDSHTSTSLFGTASIDYSADWDSDSPDGINEYSFGNYSDPNVIAVTVVWSGVPIGGRGRQIIEFDVLFDTDYNWYNCTQTNCSVYNRGMDLQNIATHETGHGAGLADVYDSACSAVTMYGYSTYGETQKRTLEQPDIAGLQKLYGA
jgi:hypothetical protein